MKLSNSTRYAITFAADCEPSLIWSAMYTATFEQFAGMVGDTTDVRNQQATIEGKDFYPVAFAEQAAQKFNELIRTGDEKFLNYGENIPEELLQICLDAGQAECDSLAQVR